jgi:alpha-D-ribose 1-methylphosphonate 5-triphosphate synthase subunit PhnL
MIEIEGVAKTFTLHNQGGAVIPVMDGAASLGAPGECVALTGPSGAGKVDADADDLRQLPGRGGPDRPWGTWTWRAPNPREVLALRRTDARVMSASSCASCRGCRRSTWWPSRCWRWACRGRGAGRAAALLARLRIPETLWTLSPRPSRAASSSG